MLGNLINDAIERFFRNLIESAVNMFLSLLNGINTVTVSVLDLPIVNKTILYSQGLAFSILVVKFTYEVWYNHILRQDGDSDADLPGVFINLAKSVVMIAAVPWLTKQMYVWGTAIASDIASLDGAADPLSQSGVFMRVIGDVQNALGASIAIAAVAIISALVLFVIVLIQAFIRAAELAVVAVSGSLMALGLTNDSSQMFQTWWRELLSLSLAQAVQIFLLKVSFYALTLGTTVPILNLLFFTGFVWVTYKSPTVIKQYLYSSGVGSAVGGTAKSVGSMVLMRRLMMRG